MARREHDMDRFWDERAAEDAFYFVDNRLTFGSPDTDQFWHQGAADLDTLLDLVGAVIAPSDEAVEIGCGVGRLTRVIAERASSVRALDVSGEMLRRAQELNPALENVMWLHGDGTSLHGIEAASADACVSHVVFQHVPDPAITLGYITEMGRVLRPGGWSAFQVSTDPSVHSRSLADRARGRLSELRPGRPGGMESPNWLGSAVSLADVEATARAADLDVARVTGAGTQYCVVKLVRG
jgi:SAM-dependent methyltransferase